MYRSIDVIWLIAFGGRQSRPWILRTYEVVKLEIGKNWLEPVLDVHTHTYHLLSPQFSYFSLLNSVAKKLFLGKKILGAFAPPPPKLRLCTEVG